MNYSLFYNYKLIGDVLMIVFENETIPTSKEVVGDVVKIYANNKLIGVNIFIKPIFMRISFVKFF